MCRCVPVRQAHEHAHACMHRCGEVNCMAAACCHGHAPFCACCRGFSYQHAALTAMVLASCWRCHEACCAACVSSDAGAVRILGRAGGQHRAHTHQPRHSNAHTGTLLKLSLETANSALTPPLQGLCPYADPYLRPPFNWIDFSVTAVAWCLALPTYLNGLPRLRRPGYLTRLPAAG